MRKLSCLFILACSLLALPAFAQQNAGTVPLCSLTAISGATNTATFQVIAAPPAATNTQFINGTPTAVSIAQAIEICGVYISIKQTTTAADFKIVSGTGTNCATGQANVTSLFFGTVSVIDPKNIEPGTSAFIRLPKATAACLFLSAAPTNAQITIVYRLRT